VLALTGPASGIRAEPGPSFTTFAYLVDDLAAARGRLEEAGAAPSPVAGSRELCLFVTARDPDGNVLVVVDR